MRKAAGKNCSSLPGWDSSSGTTRLWRRRREQGDGGVSKGAASGVMAAEAVRGVLEGDERRKRRGRKRWAVRAAEAAANSRFSQSACWAAKEGRGELGGCCGGGEVGDGDWVREKKERRRRKYREKEMKGSTGWEEQGINLSHWMVFNPTALVGSSKWRSN
ncbi:hypothetical protein Droror1_Dr00024071 [Drosera rotundifolia]